MRKDSMNSGDGALCVTGPQRLASCSDMPAARLLIPVLLGALLSRADACSSNSDCSENTFCSVISEGCMKCFWDWSDAEIKGVDANTFRSMSCAEHLDQEDETASLANCEAACACEDDNDEAATDGAGTLVYVAEPQDYDGAQAACAARGGALARVGSLAEAKGTGWTGDPVEIWIADSAGESYDTCYTERCPCISCAVAGERKPFICAAPPAGGSVPPPIPTGHPPRVPAWCLHGLRPLVRDLERRPRS